MSYSYSSYDNSKICIRTERSIFDVGLLPFHQIEDREKMTDAECNVSRVDVVRDSSGC